jgi:putative spermidine/putrescine transport system substrate-binding protein
LTINKIKIDCFGTFGKNKETAFKFVNARISEESQKAKAISLNEGPTNQQVTLSEKEAKNKTYGAIV